MPDDFFTRQRMTLVTKSLSPEAPDTSEEFPRVILFSEDGRSAFSYTGLVDGQFYDEARIIQQEEDQTYIFATLRFSNNSFTISKDSSSCVECHRGRMIWGQYRDWPGTFGPTSDLQWKVEEQDGYNKFVHFLNSKASNPRYSKYISQYRNIHANKLPPYEFIPRNPYAPGSSSFLFSMAKSHAKFVYKKIKNSSYFEDFKYLWAATMLSCPIDNLSKNQFDYIQNKLFENSNIGSHSQLFYGVDPFDGSYEHNKRSISRQIVMSSLFGVPLSDWSTRFLPTNWEPVSPFRNDGLAISLGSGKEIRDEVFKLWIEEFPYTDPQASSFQKEKWDYKYNSFLNSRYWDRIPSPFTPNHRSECQWLSDLVRSEGEGRSNKWNSLAQDIEGDLFKGKVLSHKNFSYASTQIKSDNPYKTCIGCHMSSVARIPRIPFNKPSQFMDWLNSFHWDATAGQFILGRDLIRKRVLVEKNMPPQVKLTDQELNTIQSHLNNSW